MLPSRFLALHLLSFDLPDRRKYVIVTATWKTQSELSNVLGTYNGVIEELVEFSLQPVGINRPRFQFVPGMTCTAHGISAELGGEGGGGGEIDI